MSKSPVGFEREVEVSCSSKQLMPDRQWMVISFKPNGYWSVEAVKVRALIIDNKDIEIEITNSMGGYSDYDPVLRAESFLAAYTQAIVDMKRIQEAYDSGLRSIDDIMDHVQDQYTIDQLER